MAADSTSVRLISIGSVPALLGQSEVNFTIPGHSTTFSARSVKAVEQSDSSYTWWGNLSNTNGYIGITAGAAGKVGYIQLDSHCYMLHLLSSRYNVLFEITPPNNDTIPECLTAGENPGPEEACEAMDDCPANVSVLLLVTPEAISSLGVNLNSWEFALYIPLAEMTVNVALVNSGIYKKSVRFITELYNFNYAPNNPYLYVDLDVLSFDNQAFARRSATRADLMLVVTDNRYEDAHGVMTGSWGQLPYYGIVKMGYLFGPGYVLAHEIGHALGANHNRISNGGDVDYDGDECPFGWKFNDAQNIERRTIMANLYSTDIQDGKARILNYSNSEIEYNGGYTGNDLNNNARAIAYSACSVALYFIDDELSVDIDGFAEICNETATYTAEIQQPGTGQPGSPPYLYTWRIDDDPFFTLNDPGTLLGTTSSVQILSSAAPQPEFWLFLSVHGSQGAMATSVFRVKNPCLEEPDPRESQVAPIEHHVLPKIFPNPNNGIFTVQLSDPIESTLSIQLTDVYGKASGDCACVYTGPLACTVDITQMNVAPGIYFMNILEKGVNKTVKLILYP